MGSDMAMERIHVERYARWEMVGNEQVLSLYRRSSYNRVEELLWRGQVTEQTEPLIKIHVAIIPARPKPVLPPRTKVLNLLRDWSPADGLGQPFSEETLEDMADEILEELDIDF